MNVAAAPQWLNVVQAVRVAGVSRRTLYYWIAKQYIAVAGPRTGLTRPMRIHKASLERYLDRRRPRRGW